MGDDTDKRTIHLESYDAPFLYDQMEVLLGHLHSKYNVGTLLFNFFLPSFLLISLVRKATLQHIIDPNHWDDSGNVQVEQVFFFRFFVLKAYFLLFLC